MDRCYRRYDLSENNNQWTHIEFGGAAISAAMKTFTSATSPYPIYFANPAGIFVFEDSWLYGSTDDPFRINGGKISVMRNTFEKCGYTGGEAMNAKAGRSVIMLTIFVLEWPQTD